jgi:hypothetical protein
MESLRPDAHHATKNLRPGSESMTLTCSHPAKTMHKQEAGCLQGNIAII